MFKNNPMKKLVKPQKLEIDQISVLLLNKSNRRETGLAFSEVTMLCCY